jgi:hypothetical protein
MRPAFYRPVNSKQEALSGSIKKIKNALKAPFIERSSTKANPLKTNYPNPCNISKSIDKPESDFPETANQSVH